ncbi:MAG: hypothetical protein V4501_00420 [Pseudomonadota bacterium]
MGNPNEGTPPSEIPNRKDPDSTKPVKNTDLDADKRNPINPKKDDAVYKRD